MTQKVSKSSVKVSLFKLRRLVLALVFLFAAHGVWGETYTWTGATDTDWNNEDNWEDSFGTPALNYPNSTDDVVTIPSGCSDYPVITNGQSFSVKSLSIELGASLTINSNGTLTVENTPIINGSLTVNGTFEINDDFIIVSNIQNSSSGTISVGGKLTNNTSISQPSLALQCQTLEVSANLECKSMSVTGTSSLTNTNTSGATYLVATGNDGISFGGNVIANSEGTPVNGAQFVLGGNVTATGAINLNITSGMLNHVKENTNNHKNWSSNITTVLENDGCFFGMQDGQFYKTTIKATSGDVYFVGNGTISSIDDSASNAACKLHFGDTESSENNTFTFGNGITFSKITDIVLDASCKGLKGEVTLSGMKNISIMSAKLSALADKIVPTISLAAGATISGNDVNFSTVTGVGAITIQPDSGKAFSFDSLTCNGTTSISGNNTIGDFTASGLGGETLTINGAQTITGDVSLSGTSSSNQLTVAGSGSLSLTNTLIADSLNFTGSGPSITSGTAYASNSTGNPTGWVIVDAAQFVWKGGTAGSENDWHTAANWLSPNVPPTVPGSTDDVIINAGTPVISSAGVTVKSITFNGTSELTVTGSLTIADATAFNTKISGSGKYIVASGSTHTHTVANNTTLNIDVENNGTINGNASLALPGYSITNNGTINASAALSATSIVNNGTINVSSSLTATSFSDNGSGTRTINLNGTTTSLTTTNSSTTTNALVLTGTNATIKGDFSFASFTATAATSMNGHSITLEDSTITADSVSLSGSSGSLLSLIGTGTSHKFDTSSLTASYLSIDSNILLDNYTTAIPDCVPAAGETPQGKWLEVMHNGWNIKPLSFFEFTWEGNAAAPADKTDWNTSANWDIGYVPVTDCKIIIPSTTNKPVISTVSVGGTLTIADGASVQLGANNLVLSGKDKDHATAIDDRLSNAGTIIYTAAGRITNGTNAINDVTQGTVEYAAGGTPGTVTDFYSDPTDDYNNLKITGTGWKLTGTLKMQNITIDDGVICTINSATTLQANTYTFNATGTNLNINATANLTLLPYTDGTDLRVPSGIDSKFKISSAGTLNLGNASTGNIIFDNSDTFNYFEYKLNFHRPVILKRDIVVRNSITAAENISAPDDAGGNPGTQALIFSGTGNLHFYTASGKTYQNIKIEKKGNSLTIENGGYTITNLYIGTTETLTNTPTTTFKESPTITSFSTNEKAGNITFEKGGNITNINNETIATSGNVTINSSSTTPMTITGNFNQIAGITTVKGNYISAANFTAANLVAGDNATITTSGGTQTYTTINGTTASTEELTLTASTVTLNGDVGTTKLKTLTVDADLSIGTADITLVADTINYSKDISGANFKINTTDFVSTNASATEIIVGQITLLDDTNFASTSELTLNVDTISGSKLTNQGNLKLKNGILVETAIENRTSKTITCSGDVTFANDVNLAAGTFTHSTGTVYLTAAQKSPSTLSGSNTFNNLTINAPGKTIQFADNSEQEVSGQLNLKGSDGNLLKLTAEGTTGPWSIKCSSPQDLDYLWVENSTNSTDGVIFIATNSEDKGGNSNWAFPGNTYTWNSTSSTDWFTASNWDKGSVPGYGSKVIIANTSASPKLTTKGVILSDATYTGKITINAGATFDIADQNINLGATGEFINNGRLRLKGVTGQTITATPSNGDSSVVEYYDGNSTDFIWNSNNYNNLEITGAASTNEKLIVADTTTIKAGDDTVQLSATANIFTGDIILGDGSTSAGDVTLVAAGTVKIADSAKAKSLDVTAGTIQIKSIETTAGGQTFTGAVELAADATLAAPANTILFASTSTSATDYKLTGAHKLTTSGAPVQFNGNVNIGTLETDAVIINCDLSITTSSGTTFKGDVTENTAHSLSITGPVTIASGCSGITTIGAQSYTGGAFAVNNQCTLSSGGNIEFSAATPLSASQKLTVSAGISSSITFNGAVGSSESYISELTIQQAATTTFEKNVYITKITDEPAGTVSFNAGGNLGNNFTHINNPTNITGTLDVEGSFEAGALTVTGTTKIDASSGITFNGSVDGTAESTSLETVGAVNIDTGCAAITTSGNQIYNNAVTIGATATSDPAISSSGGSLTFKDSLTLNKNLSLTATSGGISFSNESANVLGTGTLTVSAGSKPVTFDATAGTSGAHLAGLTFSSCTGTVSFNAGGYIESSLIHTDGLTIIKGTFNASSVQTDGLTLTDATTIDTGTGTQEYGTIDGTAGTETLGLTASSVTFGGVIGGAKKLASLTVDGASVINCSSITADTQTYNGAVDLGSSALITLDGTSITFNSDVSDSDVDSSLEVNGLLTIDCDNIVTKGTQVYDNAVTLNKSTILTAQTAEPANKTITFKDDVTGSTAGTKLTINADTIIGKDGLQLTVADEIDFAGDISADDKKLIINTPIFNSTKSGTASVITAATLELENNVIFASTKGIELNVTNVTGTGITLTNNADLALTSAVITIEPHFKYGDSGTRKLTASSGTTTFTGDLNLSAGSFVHSSGTVIIDPSDDSSTVTGSADSGNPTLFNNFELKKSATINGNNSYNDFTADELSDQIITFEAGSIQTVRGKLTLTGKEKVGDDENYLTIKCPDPETNTWTIKCTNASYEHEHNIKYVSVYSAVNTSEDYFLTALDSQDWGGNVKWNFPNQRYTWLGGTTKWDLASNWNPHSIPGKGAVITIPPGKTNYPQLETGLDVDISDSIGGTIEIEAATAEHSPQGSMNLNGRSLTVTSITNNGELDLAGGTLIATGTTQKTIINNNLVRLKGTETINGNMSNGDDSTVEYYDNSDTLSAFVWDGNNNSSDGSQYENLILSKPVNSTAVVSVAKTTQILTGSETVILNNSENIFSGTVTVGTSSTNAGTVTLNGKKQDGTAITLADDVYATSLTLNSSVQGTNLTMNTPVTANGINLTATSVTFKNNVDGTGFAVDGQTIADISGGSGTISTTDTQVYNGTVTLNYSTTFEASEVTFNNVETKDGNQELTVDADIKIGTTNSELAAKKIKFSGKIDSTGKNFKIKTDEFNSTKSDSASVVTASILELESNVIFASTKGIELNVTNVTGAGITLTNNADLAFTSAAITIAPHFKYGDSGTRKLTASSGTTTFKGNVDLSAGTFEHSSGTVEFAGETQTLTTASSTNFYNIKISSPANVTTDSSFIVSGTNWASTTDAIRFVALSSSVITFDNASTPAESPVTVTGKNQFYDVVCKTANQNITFSTDNIYSHYVTIGDSTNIPGTVIIGSASALTFNPEVFCNNLTINAGANVVTFTENATYGDSFTNNSTSETVINKSFTGTGDANFAGDIKLTGATNRSFSCGNDKTITTTKDIIIDSTAAGISMNNSATASIKAKNIVLYSGGVSLNGKIETTGDLILLGSQYKTQDSQTGIDEVYLYNQTRPSVCNYNSANSGELLAPSASTYDGSVSITAGTQVKVGKNFYANGITLTGTGDWNLQLAKTSDSHEGFAEAIKTTVSNCKVICHQDASPATDDTAPAKVVAYECTDSSGNTNWNFEDFEITLAYTVRDNSIYVGFNFPVRNLHNEINGVSGTSGTIQYLKYQNSTGSTASYEGIYSDPDCASKINNSDVNQYDEIGSDKVYKLYLKAPSSWNTDATGSDPGTSLSTDRSGTNKTAIPYMDIPRVLAGTSNYIITNKWGKRLNNHSTRSNGTTYTTVLDKTGPVLYSVRTGQELHKALPIEASPDPMTEKSYDSHNFIEFRYSEQVDFVGSNNDTDLNNLSVSENIQVTDSLGAVLGDITQEDNLIIAGLGKIQSGLIYTGRNGSTDRYVNSLYRLDDYSIRLSIAGYVDGAVTDSAGNVYKNWVGYIERAVQVSGNVDLLVDIDGNIDGASGRVKDRAVDSASNPAPNLQVQYANAGSNTIPEVNSSSEGLYGAWDISEPIFAIIRQNNRKTWNAELFANNYQAEAIGNPMGGSTLDRVEFHLYDNTPAFADDETEPEWFTEVGWGAHGSNADKDHLFMPGYSYTADIFGGARPFDNDNTIRTSGGIRYSSIISSAQGFKYGIGSLPPTTAFDEVTPVYSGATSLIFTGASTTRRAADDLEGLYFGLPLADRSLDVRTSFTVKYDDTKAYITDLAGNRLRSKTITTIDRTPPSIDMTISPVGADEVEMVFVKELITDSSNIHYILNGTTDDYPISEPFEYLISQCLDIITIDDTGKPTVATDLAFDTATPAKVWVTTNATNSSFTHIKLKLSRAITLDDIENKFIRITYSPNYEETSKDLFTQKDGSRVTFIQDENGNTIQMYTAHALSDFAVSAVNPLYAYDSALTWDDGTIISQDLWHKNTTDDVDTESWAVHDWNRDQKNYGTLPAGHTVAVVADSVSPNVKIYLANNPDEDSVSTQANKDFEFETPWRIWLPDVTADAFRAVSETNNTQYSEVTGTLLQGQSDRLIFDIDSAITDKWSSGNQITFLFGLINEDGTPVTIMHSPELNINQDKHYLTSSTKMPLYALRQTDPDDFLSLDLWSFRLKDIVNQRGGVTILNNVINSNDGEKVVVKVNQTQKGNVNVLVMTLDGNIVDYLHRGESEAGEHYYSWDGSNRNGNPVARGMYFIRVTGPGLDETRKVLVVK